MTGWGRRRVEDLLEQLVRLDPTACPDCLGECLVTVHDPWAGEDRIDFCRTCGGTGKKEQQR